MNNNTYELKRDNKPGGCLPVVYIVLAFILVAFLASCYTPSKAKQHTQKALIKYPGVVADIARTAFPCVTVGADTVITTQDSLIYIDCPDNTVVTATDYTGPGTVVKVVRLPGKTVRVPVTLPVRTITVTTKVEDSAKIFLITAELAKASKEVDRLQGKVERRGKLLLWLVIVLVVSLLLNYIQFKKKVA